MKIAVLDDSNILRTAIRNTLESFDYEVTFDASTSAELFEHLKKNSVDVILLDIFFPNENGLDTLRTLKQFHPDIKVIIITGMNQKTITQEAQKLGADDIIYKPFGTEDLTMALEKLRS
ncbi:DNA-binding NarL/FixJ family response regulator [Elusimicrobium simillimum]|uniref:response regulator n=1 Tax=Elusimicrobium simillimum TaxID=3143438 RepID=UPI003C6F35D5